MQTTTTQPGPNGTWSIISHPQYRYLLAGTVIWWQCFFMEMVVLGWMVFDLTNSARMVSLVSFSRTLPLLLFSLFTGPIIDRIGRRQIILLAQSVNLLCYLAIIVLLWTHTATPWTLAAVAFCLGTAWALDWPTRRALVPDLIGKERMVDGILVESFITGIARILAPALAGILIARFGAIGCYIGMACFSASAVAVLLPLLREREPRAPRSFSTGSLSLVGEGLRYVRSNQVILAVIVVTLLMNLWIFPYISLLPVFARDVLHKGPFELGLLSTATGLGSFVGLLTLTQLRKRFNVGMLFMAGTAWMGMALAVFALSNQYPLSWAALFGAGMGMACFGTLQSTIVLLATSDSMRSRVMSLLVLAIGGDPFGQLQIGTLAEHFGVQATLAGQASAALIAIGLIATRLPAILRPQPQEETREAESHHP